jgi:hypothetical protein
LSGGFLEWRQPGCLEVYGVYQNQPRRVVKAIEKRGYAVVGPIGDSGVYLSTGSFGVRLEIDKPDCGAVA